VERSVTERWKTYFDKHGAFDPKWLKSAVEHWGFHETLYGMIGRHCAPPARLLDVGSGPGWSDFYLGALGYDVTGIDNEPSLVELATLRADRLNVPAHFEVADAFDLSRYYGRYDLVFSNGVLEHFDRHVTVKLLQEQAKCAPKVLIQIPTKHTAQSDGITDERIYRIDELARIVEDAGMRVEARFGYGDLASTGTNLLLRRAMPRAVWRWLQNRGYAYCIAIVGAR
jgi:SAM-dependent methyltransferase